MTVCVVGVMWLELCGWSYGYDYQEIEKAAVVMLIYIQPNSIEAILQSGNGWFLKDLVISVEVVFTRQKSTTIKHKQN